MNVKPEQSVNDLVFNNSNGTVLLDASFGPYKETDDLLVSPVAITKS